MSQTSTLTPESAETASPRQSSRGGGGLRGFRALLIRVHFYAGIFIAPFIVMAALTGLAYTATPQLDDIAYGSQLHVATVEAERLPVAEQVAAAQRSVPGLDVTSVLLPGGKADTTRVVFADPSLRNDRERTVYVDPYTGRVKGELVTWFDSTPLETWLDDLHRNLHLGELGRNYSEVAASWLGILALTGLVLWVRRRQSARKLLLPEVAGRGRRRTRSWHATVGLWALIGLLFLSATGLTWSRYAGANFTEVRELLSATQPELSSALPATSHHDTTGDGSFLGGEPNLASIDTVVTTARDAGLDGPITVVPPTETGTAWSVAQNDRAWPMRMDQVAVDGDGQITARSTWSDWPLLAKLSSLGVAGHMGLLFGLANQLVLAVLAIAVLCIVFWGYRMWWQRRPTGVNRLTPPGATQKPGPGAIALIGGLAVIAGIAVPLLGVTLLVFLLVDTVVVGPIRAWRAT
ncbi:MAG: PepSY-associated TM helix domain-containing protein [Mycobacteriales bacterium]